MVSGGDKYVLFRSGESTWAVAASAVVEVLPTAPLVKPPGSPEALAGFMNLGGQPLAVVHLAVLLGAERSPGDDLYHHVLRLVARQGATPLGLLVDRVTDVDARAERLAPLESAQTVNGAVVGNLVMGGELTPLLDWERLLLIEEEKRIEDLASSVRARLAELDRSTS